MYEEGNRKLSFNWVSLVIKLALLAVLVFLLCWIFTRNSSNKNAEGSTTIANRDSEYINNINYMKTAAFEYFTDSTLPSGMGSSEKLTLGQMVNQKLLIDFTENGKKCDLNDSYIQATKLSDGDYALRVNLSCGNTNDFIMSTIKGNTILADNTSTDKDNEKDVNPDYVPNENDKYYDDKTNSYVNQNQNQSNTTQTNNNSSTNNGGSTNSGSSSSNSSSSKTTTKVVTKVTVTVKNVCSSCYGSTNNNNNNNNNNNGGSTNNKVLYYKYYRYTDWLDGRGYGAEDENRKCEVTTYNYCKERSNTIYSTGYVTSGNKQSYRYTLQFTNFTADQVNPSTVAVIESSEQHFGTSINDYQAYLNSRNKYITMVGGNSKYNSQINDVYTYRNSSLKDRNFDFEVSGAYRKGNSYYVDIDVNVFNANGVTAYYDPNLKFNLYYVPLKFDLTYSYNSDCIRDTKANAYKYGDSYSISDPKTETTWQHRSKEYTWSSETNLAGWTYTGISEYR